MLHFGSDKFAFSIFQNLIIIGWNVFLIYFRLNDSDKWLPLVEVFWICVNEFYDNMSYVRFSLGIFLRGFRILIMWFTFCDWLQLIGSTKLSYIVLLDRLFTIDDTFPPEHKNYELLAKFYLFAKIGLYVDILIIN